MRTIHPILKNNKVLNKVAPAVHLMTLPRSFKDTIAEASGRTVNLIRAPINLVQKNFKRKRKKLLALEAFTKSATRMAGKEETVKLGRVHLMMQANTKYQKGEMSKHCYLI